MQVPFACIKIERGCYSSFILRLNVVVADLWFFFAEVCAAVDLDDLFFGCFAWVGEAADVFLCVFCHDLEIFWLDAEHTQVVWNADLAADQTDGVDASAASVVVMWAMSMPMASAMSRKRFMLPMMLNSSTYGRRMALQTPCGRL